MINSVEKEKDSNNKNGFKTCLKKIKNCISKIPTPPLLISCKKQKGKKRYYFFGLHIFTIKSSRKINIKKYGQWLDDLKNNHSHFVDITKTPFERKKNDTKIFAYYLTQFHSIEENDAAYGKGFTEWTNVASASPMFVGHFQPKIPYDLGFYNLLTKGVMERQAQLAKLYGIYGFCFYYYWFSGKKVLEKPLEHFLKNKIDIHFHFCWANENWSKLWDGGDKEIILKQNFSSNDAKRFFEDILPFIKDERYEKIDNKPILMIYRPTQFNKDEFLKFLDILNDLAKKEGFNGFYFMASNAYEFDEPKSWGFEGLIEFPPHKIGLYCDCYAVGSISKQAKFTMVDIKPYLQNKYHLKKENYKVFKTCFPSWDNLPRKAYSNGYCFNMTEEDFALWLREIIEWTKQNNSQNEQYVYINAWNEWAEGAMLEPTTRYGYKYLDIVKKTLEDLQDK